MKLYHGMLNRKDLSDSAMSQQTDAVMLSGRSRPNLWTLLEAQHSAVCSFLLSSFGCRKTTTILSSFLLLYY